MTSTEAGISGMEELAGKLTDMQRRMLLGDYDPEQAETADASALIDAGLWSYDREKQNPDSEFYHLESTDLGSALAAHLQNQGNPSTGKGVDK